jgi:hypothetical protein
MSTHRRGVAVLSAHQQWDVRPMLYGAAHQATRPLRTMAVGQEVARGLISTPGTILSRINELNDAIDAFMLDVQAHRVRAEQESAWRDWKAQVATWVQTWRAFKDDEAGWFQRLAGETDTQVDRYWQRFCALVGDFTTRWGGHLTLPAPAQCTPAKPSDFWRSVGIGVVVSLSAAVVLYLIKSALPQRPPTAVLISSPSELEQ